MELPLQQLQKWKLEVKVVSLLDPKKIALPPAGKWNENFILEDFELNILKCWLGFIYKLSSAFWEMIKAINFKDAKVYFN